MIARLTRAWSGIAFLCALTLVIPFASPPATIYAADDLIGPVYVHVPPASHSGQKPHVLVALHGLSSNGRAFGEPLVDQANRNNWIVVAPTLRYGDWWAVEQMVREDTHFARWLVDYLDRLDRERGLPADDRVLLFGFSRGAGVLARFAFLHPERVAASAVMSSGSYTLAATTDAAGRPLAFPFGAADLEAHGGRPFDAQALQSIRWLIGVGEIDDQPKDVPQVWTPYIGPTRVDRARAFSGSLRSAGVDESVRIFPKTHHTLTHEMRNDALSFLRDSEPPRVAGSPPTPVRTTRAGASSPVAATVSATATTPRATPVPISTPTSAQLPLATLAPMPTNASAPIAAATPVPVLPGAPGPLPAAGPAQLPAGAPGPLPANVPAPGPAGASALTAVPTLVPIVGPARQQDPQESAAPAEPRVAIPQESASQAEPRVGNPQAAGRPAEPRTVSPAEAATPAESRVAEVPVALVPTVDEVPPAPDELPPALPAAGEEAPPPEAPGSLQP